jgi:Protein of unknown function (DUF559)
MATFRQRRRHGHAKLAHWRHLQSEGLLLRWPRLFKATHFPVDNSREHRWSRNDFGMDGNDGSPFTRGQAIRRGITDEELGGPHFQRIYQGVYVRAGVPVDVAMRARAALLIAPPGSHASHHTAGLLWGSWVPKTSETHISVPCGHRSIRNGVVAHRADPAFRTVRHRGILTSEPTAVFLQLAHSRLSLVDLVALGDGLVRRRRTTPEALLAAAATYQGKGARLARRAAAYVRAGVDSPTESRLRMLLVLAGLPEPEVNHIVRHADGEWRRRFDLCYPALKLIIEYDGLEHLRDKKQWSHDLLRREQLEREGWLIIVINSDALYGDPRGTLSRIRRAMISRGAGRLPARPSAAWTRTFVANPRPGGKTSPLVDFSGSDHVQETE